jgi:hypothetical protein
MKKRKLSLPDNRKSYEIRFNTDMRCMEICVLDSEGMYPLLVKDAQVDKIYCIEKTRRGGLKMSAV